jgi:hypothetical protein
MSDELIDVRTPLAVSDNVRVEVGRDGGLHIVSALVTLHLERELCEELTTTLARALVRLHKLKQPPRKPVLRVVGCDSASEPDGNADSDQSPRG